MRLWTLDVGLLTQRERPVDNNLDQALFLALLRREC